MEPGNIHEASVKQAKKKKFFLAQATSHPAPHHHSQLVYPVHTSPDHETELAPFSHHE